MIEIIKKRFFENEQYTTIEYTLSNNVQRDIVEDIISYFDEYVIVKSRQTLEKYDDITYLNAMNQELKSVNSFLVFSNPLS